MVDLDGGADYGEEEVYRKQKKLPFQLAYSYLQQEVIDASQAMSRSHIVLLVPLIQQGALLLVAAPFGQAFPRCQYHLTDLEQIKGYLTLE